MTDFNPMDLLEIGAQLSARVRVGVNCEECPPEMPRTASGWCLVCKKVLCEDHDMRHLLRTCPVKVTGEGQP